MTNYNIKFIKDMEKLSYHVTDSVRYPNNIINFGNEGDPIFTLKKR